ncbi:MAG: sporulation protein YqfC [Clostridiales bacterium]|jgi:sporulation protein YqfC|nr:sporulation protein YqfC [Clostridiales bacterium]
MKKRKLDEVKTTVSDMLELPKEITLNLPKITMIGSIQMLVENHKGIIEYTPQRIRLNSAIGVIRVQGINMNLRNIAADDILVTGQIKIVEFL